MRRRRVILAVVAGVLGSVGLITLAQPQGQVRQPDVQRGSLIAAQGTKCAPSRANLNRKRCAPSRSFTAAVQTQN